jgi:hypothetical protein
MPTSEIKSISGRNVLFERIFEVMDNIEYRRVVSPEDFEAISKLRAQAFDARIVYSRKLNGNALDDMDFADNAHVFGVYYFGDLVSTIRIQVVSREHPESFSHQMFPEAVGPLVEQGMTFIDPTKFAVDEAVSHEIPGLPLLTLRVPLMATTYFKADSCLALIKEAHEAFYRRVFRSTHLAGPKMLNGVAVPITLVQSERENTPDICRRYPVFHSTAAERRLMFDRSSTATPLTVLPTARYAMRAA